MKKSSSKKQHDPTNPEILRRMFRILLFFLVFDGFTMHAYAETSPNTLIYFNEIMYNPPGQDNNKEYIELVSDKPINLSNYRIHFNNQSDPLKPFREFPNDENFSTSSLFYYLLVEDGFNLSTIPSFDGSIYRIGERTGKNLDNTQDTLLLYNSADDLVAQTSYQASPDSLASGQGSSISLINRSGYGSWRESLPTPGAENLIDLESFIINQTLNTINTTFTNLSESNLTELCIIPSFSISTPQDIYNNKERIVFFFNISFPLSSSHLNTSHEQEQKDFTEDLSITYHVEDLDGELVRSPTTTSNTHAKSFTPAIKIPQQALLLRAVLTTPCGQQSASKLIAVRNGPFPDPSSAKGDLRESADSSARKDLQRVSGKEGTTSLTNSERKFAVTVSDLERTFSPGSLHTTIVLVDNENKPHHVTIWSYVYRGSKSYSGEREQNQQEFDLKAGESEMVELENILDDEIKPGAYKFKIKVRKDNQESTLDVTRDIVVDLVGPAENPQDQENQSVSKTEALTGLMQALVNTSQTPNNVTFVPAMQEDASSPIYQSSSAKIRSALVYFLIGLLIMVILVFVWKL